jgi:ferredoxin-NADP reductase
MTTGTRLKKMPTERARPENFSVEIVDIKEQTENTKRFFFTIPDKKAFNFIPGQFIILELPVHEKKSRRLRSYSIASPPTGEPLFELSIVLKEGGAGTTFLFNEAKPGTVFPAKGPAGKFILPETLDREICFVCTGTGITPFRSMLHYINTHKIPHKAITLIFGTRRINNILYFDEMLKLEKELENFRYIPVLSREKSTEWKGGRGYVHAIYEDLFADRRDTDFYLCGWQEMINDARKKLQEMDYSKENIHFESYG